MSAGGKRFRPMLALLAAQLGDPRGARGDPGGGGLRADPPGHAVPRRRHGRGRRAPRVRPAPTAGGPTASPSSPATCSSPGPRTCWPTSARRRCASRRRPSSGWSPARSARPSAPQPGEDPVAHYLECWPTRPARWSRPPPGSARASPASTSRLVDGADRVRRGGRASPSSSPTTCSTSSARAAPPGSRRAPTCARASRPCRRCSPSPATTRPRRGCASSSPARSPTTPTTPRRSRLLRSSRVAGPGQRGARAVRRPGPGPAGRRAGRRRPRRAVGALRLRGHPHQLTAAHACGRSQARGGALHGRLRCSPGARRRSRRPSGSRRRRPGAPALEVEVVADGLDHPWDVAQAPDGTLLVDERAGGFTAVLPDGTRRSEVDGRLRRPLRPGRDRA